MSPNKGPIYPKIDVEALKKRDEKAFALFVRTYQDMVFASCRSAGLTGADIEDAASEAFLAAFQSIHRFKGRSKLSSWLWTIAYRKAVNIQRKNIKKQCISNPISDIPAEAAAPTPDSTEAVEQSRAIWQAVDTLPRKWAPAIVLFYREGKSIAEIAEILDVPENSIKTYLSRGRKKLYIILQNMWKKDYVKS